jgi:hypothetical protein
VRDEQTGLRELLQDLREELDRNVEALGQLAGARGTRSRAAGVLAARTSVRRREVTHGNERVVGSLRKSQHKT